MTHLRPDSPDTPTTGRKNVEPSPRIRPRLTAKPAWPTSSACPWRRIANADGPKWEKSYLVATSSLKLKATSLNSL
jgi:hypothetical protein